MKIAATITKCNQIGESTFRDVNITKIFDEIATIKDISDWAKTYNDRFENVLLSIIDEATDDNTRDD